MDWVGDMEWMVEESSCGRTGEQLTAVARSAVGAACVAPVGLEQHDEVAEQAFWCRGAVVLVAVNDTTAVGAASVTIQPGHTCTTCMRTDTNQ